MKLPIQHFHYCPRCGGHHDPGSGSDAPVAAHETVFRCQSCGFTYYFNPANAAGAFISNRQGEILFIRRAREPAKGQLAIPGGFVDLGETAEDALRRESREEVNLELGALRYLCSQCNEYPYQGVNYPVLDLFFTARALSGGKPTALDGVESCAWLAPSAVRIDELAFPSIRSAWGVYLRKIRSRA